jgi:hypothetical protein
MASDVPHADDGPPTEEIYLELRDLELRDLEAAVPETQTASPGTEPIPAIADDDPTGIKARIARLRAVLADRGVEPPS